VDEIGGIIGGIIEGIIGEGSGSPEGLQLEA